MSDTAKKTVLVVEDEPDIRELVRYNLEGAGFQVVEAPDGEAALRAVRRQLPSVVLLDLLLPGGDGLEVCRILRGEPATAALPIVILTAKAAEVDRVLGLELGADDYVTKPFSPRELVARLRAVLRRAERVEPARVEAVYEHGRLKIDFDRREARVDGQPLALSRREFELLKFFVNHPHRVYDRLAILDLVWGGETYVEPRTVDVHVRRLRMRIEREPANPGAIQTVRGVGYRFDPGGLV